MRDFNKIFMIGMFKTGTSTIQDALESGYGIRTKNGFASYDRKSRDELRADLKEAVKRDPELRGFRGFPYIGEWEFCDKTFPNSLFILTVRNERDWLMSAAANWPNDKIDIHRTYLGTAMPVEDPVGWVKAYRKHNRDVIEYFKTAPERFETLNVIVGPWQWDGLSSLLGSPADKPWPHSNKTEKSRFNREQVADVLAKYDEFRKDEGSILY